MRPSLLVATFFVLALLAVLVLADESRQGAAASAANGLGRTDVPSRSRAPIKQTGLARLADAIAADWERGVTSDGQMPIIGTAEIEDGYGQAMWAYALLRKAARTGDARTLQRALAMLERRVRPDVGSGGAFEQLALSTIYADYRLRKLLPRPTRSGLRRELAGFGQPRVGERAKACQRSVTCYSNLKLVDAVATLTLDAAGITSTVPGSKLAARDLSVGEARGLFVALPSLLSPGKVQGPRGQVLLKDPTVLSDPSRNPLAYHALSMALLDRASRLDGEVAANRSVRALRDTTLRAAIAATAPDGDMTYVGRGQRQIWTSAATLSAALGRLADAQAARDDMYARELYALAASSERLIRQARDMGEASGQGLAVTPASRAEGVDGYASRTTYVALTLFWLNLASDAAARVTPLQDPGLLSGRMSSYSWTDPATGTITRGKHGAWIAVRLRATHPKDSRYDAGLIAFKVRGKDGVWRDVLSPRPFTDRPGAVVLRGGPALPNGWIFSAATSSVTADGIRLCGAFGRAMATPRSSRTCVHYELQPDRSLRISMTGLPRLPVRMTFPVPVDAVARLQGTDIVRAEELLIAADRPFRDVVRVSRGDASALVEHVDRVAVTTSPARRAQIVIAHRAQ